MMSALGLYSMHVIIFNEVHLRQKNEGICWKVVLGIMYVVLLLYAFCQWVLTGLKMPYKLLMAMADVASYYWSLVQYTRYFSHDIPNLQRTTRRLGWC
jgi:hypothetical protein